MKSTIKYLSIALAVVSVTFASCKKDDCDDGPNPDTKDCNTELIFMDHAFCSGDWFKTTNGEYLEVYGYPNSHNLKKGDRVRFGYSNFDNSHIIECMAISPFEMWLGENNLNYKTVKANKACFENEGPVGCDNELECVDLGICGGVWFKDAHNNYLEVYNYPYRNTLNVGDKVRFGYDDHTRSGNVCSAMTQWEVEFFESGQPYKIVKAREECFEPICDMGECDTEVTYFMKDFCSGDLLRKQDGTLLRAFGLGNKDFNEGDKFIIGYLPKTLQNDCYMLRKPEHEAMPVDITCFKDNAVKR